MEDRLLLALGILAFIYLVWRSFPRRQTRAQVKVRDRVEEVINSDKYKVKGQYD